MQDVTDGSRVTAAGTRYYHHHHHHHRTINAPEREVSQGWQSWWTPVSATYSTTNWHWTQAASEESPFTTYAATATTETSSTYYSVAL